MGCTYFHIIYNCSTSSCGIKIDKCVFIGWSFAVFILLANIFNCTFNLFISNEVREPIIDVGLLWVLKYLGTH